MCSAILSFRRCSAKQSISLRLRAYRGHPFAKSAVDMALADLSARLKGRSLADDGLAGRRARVEVGVSIGIHPSIDATLAIIEKRLIEGYRRIKLKIKPGWDVDSCAKCAASTPPFY